MNTEVRNRRFDFVGDYAIPQGANWNIVIEITDVNGEALPLTSVTAARMHIRESVNATTTLFELTTANGRITLDKPNGWVYLNMNATETAGFPWKYGVYDLELVYGSENDVERYLQGRIEVDPEVTR